MQHVGTWQSGTVRDADRLCALLRAAPQLSPYQQDVVGQAFKNAPKTLLHMIQEVRTHVASAAHCCKEYPGRGWLALAACQVTTAHVGCSFSVVGNVHGRSQHATATAQKGPGLVTLATIYFGAVA
jgi:hypothetical protein